MEKKEEERLLACYGKEVHLGARGKSFDMLQSTML
jgi:hypothetical protein